MPSKHGARSSVSTVRAYSFPRIAAVLLFAVFLLFVQYRHSPFIVKATSHQPEAYTELYFNNPSKLPTLAGSNDRVPLNFTIHNLEGRSVDYTYRIEFAANGRTIKLQERHVSLADSAAASVTGDVLRLPTFKGRAEITVLLTGRPEAIHFWVESMS